MTANSGKVSYTFNRYNPRLERMFGGVAIPYKVFRQEISTPCPSKVLMSMPRNGVCNLPVFTAARIAVMVSPSLVIAPPPPNREIWQCGGCPRRRLQPTYTPHCCAPTRWLISAFRKARSQLEWRECRRTFWCPRTLFQNCHSRRGLERFGWPALRTGLGAPCR